VSDQSWVSVKDELPPRRKYVLIHLTKTNWIDEDDPDYVYCDVAMRVSAKYEGNNQRHYSWETFGPSSYFGQEVDYWCPIPKLPVSQSKVT